MGDQTENGYSFGVWETVVSHQGKQFYTIKGLPFVYHIKGGECFIDRRKKSITRATFEKAYEKFAGDTEGLITGPKQLCVFGAPYIWAIFKGIGWIE